MIMRDYKTAKIGIDKVEVEFCCKVERVHDGWNTYVFDVIYRNSVDIVGLLEQSTLDNLVLIWKDTTIEMQSRDI